MGTGNIEGLARMPIIEMSWTGTGLHIAEDLVHYDIIGRGVESQLTRIGHPALYQLQQTGGIDRLQAFPLPPTAQVPVIFVPAHDGEKGILDPQPKYGPKENSEGHTPARQ